MYARISAMKAAGQKALALLMDPDKLKDARHLDQWVELVRHSETDFLFLGGSIITQPNDVDPAAYFRKHLDVPVVLFPGNWHQINTSADALLFLSLISGRNADLLIGQHVHAAPVLKKMGMETISTGYMLVDCGNPTSASYMSQTMPLPYDKPEIAAATALAAEMLGMKCLYLDGGSGAARPVSVEMIAAVAGTVSLPLMVGGGIRTEEHLKLAYAAGADIVVVGTAVEQAPELLFSLADVRTAWKK